MSARRALTSLALLLLVVGCAGERQPTGMKIPTAVPHAVRWAGGHLPQFSAGNVLPEGNAQDGLHAFLSGGLSLDRNTATFWAVRGQQRSIQINYLSATGGTSAPFLKLTLTDPIFVPGRGNLAVGDSVLITVTIDPNAIEVSLEPTGLQFGNPAEMKISYGGAAGDLNGDGVVNATDAEIEAKLLGMWYREGSNSTWEQIPASQTIADKSFTCALQHFSQYAVSFLEYAVSW